MKKIILFPLLFVMNIIVFAQHKPFIATSKLRYATGTTTTFSIPDMDKDLCIKKLINSLGTPSVNTTGKLTWKHISIKELDGDARLQLRNGIMTRDLKNSSECWSAFDNEADKQRRLAQLTKDQWRDLTIEVTDQNGGSIVDNAEKEQLVKDFLAGVLERN